jgi:Uma2 family endonuclease
MPRSKLDVARVPAEVCWDMPSTPSPAEPDLPGIDDRLVEPGTRFEMLDGELVYVPPADGPHARRHAQVCVLLEARLKPGYEVMLDLLTRTSKVDDIAPDISVRITGVDPSTGQSQLPEIAFEIVSTQSLEHAGRKANKLLGRGTRRVFAVDVEQSRALEWTAAGSEWALLAPSGCIEDPVLAVSLPIGGLIHAIKTDDDMVSTALAKRHPMLEEKAARDRAEGEVKGRAEGEVKGRAEGEAKGRAEGRAEGLAEGKAKGRAEARAEAVIAVLTAHGVSLDLASRERILAESNQARLDRWIVRAASCATVDELFADP